MYGNQTLQHSIAFNAVRCTADNGPFNSWGRAPYVTFAPPAQNRQNVSLPPVNGGVPQAPTAHSSWSHFKGNLLLTNYHSVWPLDQDDGSSLYVQSGNVMAWGGFKNYLGWGKRSVGNIYVYPDAVRAPPPPLRSAVAAAERLGLGWYDGSTSETTGSGGDGAGVGGFFTKPYCANSDGQARGDSGFAELYANNTCFIHSSDIYEFGSCDPSDPFDLVPLPRDNLFHTDNSNVTIKCGGKEFSLAQWQALGMDLGSTVRGPANVSQIVAQSRAMLGL